VTERTQRRLRQARFFYQHLVKQTEGEEFRFYFFAFIVTARSVIWTLSKEEKEKWKALEHNLSKEERKLLKITTDLRNAEEKEGGADLPVDFEEVMIDVLVEVSPPKEGVINWAQLRQQKANRPVHYFEDKEGKEEITKLCERYLNFLEKMVKDFCA
jgi:hypothetical protein